MNDKNGDKNGDKIGGIFSMHEHLPLTHRQNKLMGNASNPLSRMYSNDFARC